MLEEEFRDRGRFLGRDHKIDIAHNFPAPAITSGHLDLKGVGMRRQISPERFRFGGNLAKLEMPGMLRALLDRRANFCLRRFPKSRQFRDPARLARLPQLLDRADVKLFVERFDFLGPEPGD